jgi:hypothetical protein
MNSALNGERKQRRTAIEALFAALANTARVGLPKHLPLSTAIVEIR